MRKMIQEFWRTVRYAIDDEGRTARLKSLLVTTAIVVAGCYALVAGRWV
ncbi:hypothetical protein SAMN05216252_108321 [Actinacidiphila glaucinigra]|uniref:Uncharacterized protein n=1 Tax=Actinacidiphila glaucinigra TaxID=235986 RepID=A0A239HDF0_9ACTN|nr:hypothetical protein SAMN05216252_108321 [Actinacidiphila glaucinigra]